MGATCEAAQIKSWSFDISRAAEVNSPRCKGKSKMFEGGVELPRKAGGWRFKAAQSEAWSFTISRVAEANSPRCTGHSRVFQEGI